MQWREKNRGIAVSTNNDIIRENVVCFSTDHSHRSASASFCFHRIFRFLFSFFPSPPPPPRTRMRMCEFFQKKWSNRRKIRRKKRGEKRYEWNKIRLRDFYVMRFKVYYTRSIILPTIIYRDLKWCCLSRNRFIFLFEKIILYFSKPFSKILSRDIFFPRVEEESIARRRKPRRVDSI